MSAPPVSSATALLLRDGQVLLLRRSAHVVSHAGRWSAVSGKLEAGESPLAAAWREIAEETGFGQAELILLAEGTPRLVDEARCGITWRVHPFLFALRSARAPRLCAEHVEARWCLPHELAALDPVPGLAAALAELLQRAGPAARARHEPLPPGPLR